MPVPVACVCGWSATVPDEHAGRLGTCPKCKARVRVSRPPAPAPDEIPTARPIPPFEAISSNVAGVVFANETRSSRQQIIGRLRVRDPLLLAREPGNPHDPNAIRVTRTTGGQIGYVPADLAKRLAPEIDGGTILHAFVAWVGVREEIDRHNLRVEMIIVRDRDGAGRDAALAFAGRHFEAGGPASPRAARPAGPSLGLRAGRALRFFSGRPLLSWCLTSALLGLVAILAIAFRTK